MAIKTLAAIASLALCTMALPAMAQFLPLMQRGPNGQMQYQNPGYLPTYVPPPPPVYRAPMPYVPPQQGIQPMIVYPGSGTTLGYPRP